jgi:CheY-like chemotaxis protein
MVRRRRALRQRLSATEGGQLPQHTGCHYGSRHRYFAKNIRAFNTPNGWREKAPSSQARPAPVDTFAASAAPVFVTPKRQSSSTIRVLCADNHSIVRDGIAFAIQGEIDMQLVGEAMDGEEAVREFQRLRPDIALLDLHLPVLNISQREDRNQQQTLLRVGPRRRLQVLIVTPSQRTRRTLFPTILAFASRVCAAAFGDVAFLAWETTLSLLAAKWPAPVDTQATVEWDSDTAGVDTQGPGYEPTREDEHSEHTALPNWGPPFALLRPNDVTHAELIQIHNARIK